MMSPTKVQVGSTNHDMFGHSIPPAEVCPISANVATDMPLPTYLKKLRFLLGVFSYYIHLLSDLSKRLHPNTAFLKQGVKLSFTQAMEVIPWTIFSELAQSPVFLLFDWDAVAGGTRSFYLNYDANIDCLSYLRTKTA